jgi:glycosyltransferase involved in cell wall biosynthesis
VVATNVVDTEERENAIGRLSRDDLYASAHNDTDFIVLFVGSLYPGKRVGLLLEGFAQIGAEQDQLERRPRLWIVGDGPQRRALEAQAQGLGEQVRFFGQVTEGISALFLSSDVFVLPGLGGLAISDALVHGLPVVASIGDGTEADLVTSDVGILDEDLNAERLAMHLRLLRRDAGLRSRLSAAARRKIRAGANTDNYVKRLHEAIAIATAHGRQRRWRE